MPAELRGALAPYACDPRATRGRRIAEPPSPPRTDFQRDRDRIVHCTAFRRLVYKTQVFLNHEGDLFRTRLTHSIEVAQIARSLARALHLEEDLVEAIALAHDLGHTPFGHAGQDALDDCMRGHGGFEHNLQSLRVVDRLEQRYPAFDGLNLCFETREGILKHCSPRNARRLDEREPGGVAQRFLDGTQPGLEAQLTNLADQIAYSAHDIDDGVRSGLVTIEQLDGVPLVGRILGELRADDPAIDGKGRRLLFEVIRRMLAAQVADVTAATSAALSAAAPEDADAARRAGAPLVRFSAPMQEQTRELQRFLMGSLYRHPQVIETTERGKQVVRELFQAYVAQPDAMPADYALAERRERAVADYIAGMTDRYAVREHQRLTGRSVF